ncbi:MAG: hypothetical protein HYZ24_16350 [Chloroflexi bacterium]|nr:hypothetical protein [Chloroflexota bacterium]
MPKEDLTDSVITHLRNFASIIGLLGAVSYIAGFLIANFYVGKYGGSAFNLVQSRYFATGGLFLILSVLVLIGPTVSFTVIQRAAKDKDRGYIFKNILLVLLGFLLSSITIWYSGNILSGLNSNTNFLLPEETRRTGIWLGLFVTSVALLTPIVLFFLSKWVSAKLLVKNTQSAPAWLPAVFGSLGVFLFIISLWLFSEFIYPYVPPAFGGNAPTQVQVIFSDDLAGMQDFPIKHSGGISETVVLIDQTPTSLLILLPDSGRVIEIPYSEVMGIIR